MNVRKNDSDFPTLMYGSLMTGSVITKLACGAVLFSSSSCGVVLKYFHMLHFLLQQLPGADQRMAGGVPAASDPRRGQGMTYDYRGGTVFHSHGHPPAVYQVRIIFLSLINFTR